MRLVPTLELGLFRNFELDVAVPILLGTADRAGSGNIEVSALYNFKNKGLLLSAFAITGRAALPTGKKATGVDTSIKGILTKTITETHRPHANFEYTFNQEPSAEFIDGQLKTERQERYTAIAGYSGRVGPITVLVINYVHQQERLKDELYDWAEIGIRKQVTPRVVFSIGGSTGLTKETPNFLVNLGLQRAF